MCGGTNAITALRDQACASVFVIFAAVQAVACASGASTENNTSGMNGTMAASVTEGIWLIGSPILLAVGSAGNIVCIAVMSRKSLRETTARLLLVVLAFADLLNLYSGLLRHWIRVGFGLDVRERSNASCKIHIFVVYFAFHFQAWLLVIITAERFVAVYFPHSSKILFTRKRAAMAVGATAGVLLLINAHFFWTTYMAYDELGGYCAYRSFFDEAWVWIDLCLASLAPFAIMISLNSAIAWRLRQHRKYRRQQSSIRRQTRLTVLLLAVALAFFVLTLPLCVHLILVNGVFADVSDPYKLDQIDLSFAICSILAYTNNAINFFMYCIGGQRFRRELVLMCWCRCCSRSILPTETCATATEVTGRNRGTKETAVKEATCSSHVAGREASPTELPIVR